MKASEIRSQFIDFFAKKGHKILPSASIVVKNDPTLMFVNAGMNPFKDIFLGNKEPETKRVVNTQKCLRVSGKHNDLEEVGVDTYHHTMFEMMGNWSFGDYFKEDAISWAWELLTEVYKLPKDRLYVTIFEGDDSEGIQKDIESAKIWERYIEKDRILLGNKKDNFWEMGDVGPCGPCSEIHFDSRSDEERKQIDGKSLVNEDHPEVIEIWNNVFMEFNRKKDSSLESLPSKHVDTGMGFERLVRVIQGKTSNYDTDVFSPLIQKLESLSAKKYGGTDSKEDIAFRVIVDHIRAITMTISDGQIPSNTGAGYVIRRILRRAIRYGYTYLGFESAFMYQLVEVLGNQSKDVFPEIEEQKAYSENVIREEEISFFKTLSVGVKLFNEKASQSENKTISGVDAFELYDTYGFPIDLTRLMAAEQGFSIDEKGFEEELEKQKDRSRAATKLELGDWNVLDDSKTHSEFIGYSELEAEVHLLRYREVKTKKGSQFQLVFDKTPFYAESGGQVGDTGVIIDTNDNQIRITNTLRENETIVHFVNELPKDLSSNFRVRVDILKRKSTAKNHSATHLLQSALKEVLGDHIQQKGSLVNEKYLRFDFSHFAKLSDDEISKVESIVNNKISDGIKGDIESNIPIQDAMDRGVTALFGEKYGDFVRVVTFDENFSMELCGGTHVSNTNEIGFFKIVSESSIASGIRRIEALTSSKVIEYFEEKESTLSELNTFLKNPQSVLQSVQNLSSDNATLKKCVSEYEQTIANYEFDKIKIGDYENAIFISYDNMSLSILKTLSSKLRGHYPDKLVVLATKDAGKLKLMVICGDKYLEAGYPDAKSLVKDIAPIIKGGGGGQPGLATAVGNIETDINELKSVLKI